MSMSAQAGALLETARLKWRNNVYLPVTRDLRQRDLKVREFTIISNNCWGGTVYESYGLRKESPTVGMFIMPEDFLRLVGDLPYHLSCRLELIDPTRSSYREELSSKGNWGTYLIGRLDDVELHMLHYHDPQVACRKWAARVERVHADRLLFKLNDQNGCTPQQMHEFLELPLPARVAFASRKEFAHIEGVTYIPQPSCYSEGVMASREPLGHSRYTDVTNLINSL